MPKANITLEVYNALKQRIINWEYPPGHHLIEDSIRQEFNVSRIPVREALRMLEEKNFVEKIPNKGCKVKQPNFNEIQEIYEARMAIEFYLINQLAEKGMKPEIWQDLHHQWLSLQQELEATTIVVPYHNQEDIALLDQSFHETLASSAGNSFMFDLLRMINERLYFLRTMDITTTDKLLMTCKQHLKILDHIKAQNPQLAKQALQENIDYGRSNVQENLRIALARSVFGNG